MFCFLRNQSESQDSISCYLENNCMDLKVVRTQYLFVHFRNFKAIYLDCMFFLPPPFCQFSRLFLMSMPLFEQLLGDPRSLDKKYWDVCFKRGLRRRMLSSLIVFFAAFPHVSSKTHPPFFFRWPISPWNTVLLTTFEHQKTSNTLCRLKREALLFSTISPWSHEELGVLHAWIHPCNSLNGFGKNIWISHNYSYSILHCISQKVKTDESIHVHYLLESV